MVFEIEVAMTLELLSKWKTRVKIISACSCILATISGNLSKILEITSGFLLFRHDRTAGRASFEMFGLYLNSLTIRSDASDLTAWLGEASELKSVCDIFSRSWGFLLVK